MMGLAAWFGDINHSFTHDMKCRRKNKSEYVVKFLEFFGQSMPLLNCPIPLFVSSVVGRP